MKFFHCYLNYLFYGAKYGAGLKMLTPKEILQRLPIALAQVKVGNNSDNLLNEIRQIAYSLHQSKDITNKLYNTIIKSIQIQNVYFIYELRVNNSKAFKPHVLMIKLTDKI